MAGAGRRERATVATIDQLQAQGFTNIIDVRVGEKVYRFATKDTTVDFPSMSYAEIRNWVMQNFDNVRVFEVDPNTHIAMRELSRRDVPELPLPEVGEAVPRRAEFRLGKGAAARTRQIIHTLETGEFEGITYPGPGGTRKDFFGQFTEEERRFLQRAWITATDAEKRLFADELNAFFHRAGEGVVGMETLLKMLRRMAGDYLSREGPYAEDRFFTITDLYYYARAIMAEEPQEGTGAARERKIKGIGRYMEREGIGRRYERLVDELKEERRAAVVRRVPELEAPPVTAETVPAPVEEAAPTVPRVMTEPERISWEYTQVEFREGLLRRGGISPAAEERIRAEIARIEDGLLARIEALSPGERRHVEWIKARILARREAAAPAVAAAPPVEEVPARAPPAPVEEVVYNFAWADGILARILDLSGGRLLDKPDILTIEGMRELYEELYAHIDEAINNTTDPAQKDLLTRVKNEILVPVLGPRP